jgi:hypothetical protein
MTPLSRSATRAGEPTPVPTRGCDSGAPLASRRAGEACLVLAALVLAAGGGCLIPQNVDKTTVLNPPRIVTETLSAKYFVPFLTLTRTPRDVGCTCELALSIPEVEEDDPTASIEGRWFIDYDIGVATSQRQASTSLLKGSFDFTTVRAPGPSYNVSPDTLGADGFHTVEVVIGDSAAFLSSDDATATLPNRTLSPGNSSAVFRFFIKLQTDLDAAQCPQTAPAIRTCAGGN